MTSIARAVILATALSASVAHADQTIWDESVNGDLSGDRLAPNTLNIALGINTLIATSSAGDREYVRMVVPAGMQLTQIMHVSWQSTDSIAFIAVQRGGTFTEPPTGTNVANILGYTHFGPGAGNLGADILPGMGTGAGSQGFSPPLGPDTYTFWIQQTSPSLATYRLDFVLAPAPGTAMIGIGALTVLARRRRTS